MAVMTGEEGKVLELVAQKRELTREQISQKLPLRTPQTAAPVENLIRVGFLSEPQEKAQGPDAPLSVTGLGKQYLILARSLLTLRLAIGMMGIFLPFVLLFGNLLFGNALKLFDPPWGIQGSISAYYYTGMRNVFVGVVWAIAIVLFSYKEYGGLDSLWTKVAGISAILVALFPTSPEGTSTAVGAWHLRFAATLFGALALICFFAFTKEDPAKIGYPQRKTGKKRRNLVYIACGMAIVLTLVAIAVLRSRLGDAAFGQYKLLFVLETVALFFFGFSWMWKSNWLIDHVGALSRFRD